MVDAAFIIVVAATVIAVVAVPGETTMFQADKPLCRTCALSIVMHSYIILRHATVYYTIVDYWYILPALRISRLLRLKI